MANTSRNSMGIGRGKVRGDQHPHVKPDSVSVSSDCACSQNSTSPNQDCCSTDDPGAGGDTVRNSRLSAEANEFYPRNYQRHSIKVSEDVPAAPVDEDKRLPQSELVFGRLLDVINSVTMEPGAYKSAVQPFFESFGSLLGDSYVLSIILNIIIEQSVVQPNFRYSGARMCNDLNEFLADSQQEFRRILLERCKEEVDEVLKHFDSEPVRLQGVVGFLAELYIQLELKPGTRLRINILRDALYELLQVLVSSPAPENIKCTCMILKLAGYALDQDDSTAMDALLQSLHKVALSPPYTHIAAMVDNIKQLRLTSWGTGNMTEPSVCATDFLQEVAVEETEPVFYGPDGIVLTHEESTFLQENLAPDTDCYEELWYNGNHSECDNDGEMNEEEEAAYEEFLRMTENNKKQ